MFQSKVLRTILNVPWFVRNAALYKDFQIPIIAEYIEILTVKFFNYVNFADSAKFHNLRDYQ